MKTYYPICTVFGVLGILSATGAAQPSLEVLNTATGQFALVQSQDPRGLNLVPLRDAFEQTGARVKWDRSTITVQKGTDTIRLRIGSRTAYVNDRLVLLDAPVQIINGAAMIPLRFVSEYLKPRSAPSVQPAIINTSVTSSQIDVKRPIRLVGQHSNLIRSGTVIPVVLTVDVPAGGPTVGERITATLSSLSEKFGPPPVIVQTNSSRTVKDDAATPALVPSDQRYGPLPPGTRFTGHVVSVSRPQDSELTSFVFVFDQVSTPGGRSSSIDGSPLTLDTDKMSKDGSGLLTATSDPSRTWTPTEKLARGSVFGIRLNRDLTLSNK